MTGGRVRADLESMGDLGEFIAWSETGLPRVLQAAGTRHARLVVNRRGLPGEFVPLEIRITNKRRELEELEGIKVHSGAPA
jgi:hypothetical protein